jgi:hypothetical protein
MHEVDGQADEQKKNQKGENNDRAGSGIARLAGGEILQRDGSQNPIPLRR